MTGQNVTFHRTVHVPTGGRPCSAAVIALSASTQSLTG